MSGICRRLMQAPCAHALAPLMQKRTIINDRITVEKYQGKSNDTRSPAMIFQQHVPPHLLKHVGPEGRKVLDKARFCLNLCPIKDATVLQVIDLQYVCPRGGDQMDFLCANRSVTQIDGFLHRLVILNVKYRMDKEGINNYAHFAEYVVQHVMNLQRIFP